jgi:hypothetical protein
LISERALQTYARTFKSWGASPYLPYFAYGVHVSTVQFLPALSKSMTLALQEVEILLAKRQNRIPRGEPDFPPEHVLLCRQDKRGMGRMREEHSEWQSTRRHRG